MTLFHITEHRAELGPEVMPTLQLGWLKRFSQYCLIVADEVAVVFDEALPNDLRDYYGAAFGTESTIIVDRRGMLAERIAACLFNFVMASCSMGRVIDTKNSQTFFDVPRSVAKWPPPSPSMLYGIY
jgi:hypothetical protein